MSQLQRAALVVCVAEASTNLEKLFSQIESFETIGLSTDGLWIRAEAVDSRLQLLEAKL